MAVASVGRNDMVPMTPIVSGKKHIMGVKPDTLLLGLLHNALELTGMKSGCGGALCNIVDPPYAIPASETQRP